MKIVSHKRWDYRRLFHENVINLTFGHSRVESVTLGLGFLILYKIKKYFQFACHDTIYYYMKKKKESKYYVSDELILQIIDDRCSQSKWNSQSFLREGESMVITIFTLKVGNRERWKTKTSRRLFIYCLIYYWILLVNRYQTSVLWMSILRYSWKYLF